MCILPFDAIERQNNAITHCLNSRRSPLGHSLQSIRPTLSEEIITENDEDDEEK